MNPISSEASAAEPAIVPATGAVGPQQENASHVSALWNTPSANEPSTVGNVQIGSIVLDLLMMFVSFVCGFSVINIAAGLGAAEAPRHTMAFHSNLVWWGLYTGICILWFHSLRFYRPGQMATNRQELTSIAFVFSCVTLALAAVAYFSDVRGTSTQVLALSTALNVGVFTGVRILRRSRVRTGLMNGSIGRNALIIGAGPLGSDVAQYLERNQQLGYRVRGFVTDEPEPNSRVLGKLVDLPTVCRTAFVDEIFITTALPQQLAREIFELARRERIDVTLVPDLSFWASRWMAVERVGRLPTITVHREAIPAGPLFVKRLLDICASAIGILLLAPMFAVLALLIKLDSKGPIFYCSKRVGRKGREFRFYKFRTMIANADALKDELRHLNKRDGAFFKVENDPRVTRLGRVLRRYSLDEFPQLFNVLVGDMSLVGPRPHPIDDYRQYKVEHLRRLDVVPGITGLWQVSARRDPSFELNMALDMEYINHWSLWLDVKILARTFPAVFAGAGE
jgi:exopolysaccharide biosynthesis polyprenyl glycosylphosphotransferase